MVDDDDIRGPSGRIGGIVANNTHRIDRLEKQVDRVDGRVFRLEEEIGHLKEQLAELSETVAKLVKP